MPGDTWGPYNGQTVGPLDPSPSGTVVLAGAYGTYIRDANKNVWTISQDGKVGEGEGRGRRGGRGGGRGRGRRRKGGKG